VRLQTLVPLALVAAAAFAACNNTTTSTVPSVPYSQTDIVVGTGDLAVTGKLITVNYSGFLYDASKPDNKGAEFDTTVGGTPFTFTLGAGQVIQGWEQGVPGMQVGGIRRLVIPPSLGYGSTRNGPIPPNATLIFEITLETVQ
jgi:FKBP-type peptidyl-prolyl cis-trans isomerase FkpA